ncbi:polygalacturonase-like [Argentina anserina]|uniref:polygalacturonase-like n=1 Tax=Argentina anserina TaxID=57926 RepID=UPI00217667B2|nr:polygalacturonase-like [Potentilla anserina]
MGKHGDEVPELRSAAWDRGRGEREREIESSYSVVECKLWEAIGAVSEAQSMFEQSTPVGRGISFNVQNSNHNPYVLGIETVSVFHHNPYVLSINSLYYNSFTEDQISKANHAASTGAAAQSNVFDVTSSKYGGKTDSDISEALTMAWKDACASPSMSNVLVPMGTFKLSQQATFEGPCNAPIQFQLQGTVQAPEDRSHLDDSWVHFKAIDKLTLSGGGTFDGQGELFWKHGHGSTPVDIRFKTVNNSIISGISFINSAKFHISVHDSDNITFQQVTITAPEDSHNTDGIHIASSSRITVSDSYIATGDDCVSIGDGSNQILVSNITCGPGHGISIGSLGKYPDEQPVVGVTVRNCTLTATTNGARIKTWPDSPSASVARDILYEDIIMEDVKNPILINQNYCDKGKTCRLDNPSKVQISDVRAVRY